MRTTSLTGTLIAAALLVGCGGGGNANNLEGRYLAECTLLQSGNYTRFTLGIAGSPQAATISTEDQQDILIEKGTEEGAVIHDQFCDVLLEPDGSEDLEMDKDTECATSSTRTS